MASSIACVRWVQYWYETLDGVPENVNFPIPKELLD
jgi:hypothetical protein